MEPLRRVVLVAPEASTLALLALAVPVAVLVTLGMFRPWAALVLAALSLVGLWWFHPPRAASTSPSALASVTALLGVLVWIAVQLRYTGEFIAVDRDPAVYALTGLWLVDHPSVTVPTAAAAEAAAGVPGARTAGLGFGQTVQSLSPEFVHTVPGIVALAGWMGGTASLLAANVVVGGMALLAVYSAARALVGDWWALLPPTGLALAMPMVAFSRSVYSEPLSLAMIGAGTACLALVVTGRSPCPGRTAVMAGLYFGAVGIVRIDGALLVSGAMVAVAAWALLVPPARAAARTVAAGVAGPGVALVAVGMADMARNSGDYLLRHAAEAGALLVGLAGAGVVMALGVAYAGRASRWISAHRSSIAVGGTALLVLVAAVLLSRPAWMQARTFAANEVLAADIERYQAAEGLPLDGTRSYDELSVEWVSWYHGWLAVALGMLGVALLSYQVLRGHRPAVLALVPLGLVALLYLIRPSITPDHVWAMRRLVTGAVPLLLIAGTALLAWWARRSRLGVVLGAIAGAAVAVWPLTTWSSMFEVRDRVGQVAEAQAACEQITDGRVVLAGGAPGVDYLPTLRIVCDAQVVALRDPTPGSLARLRQNWGGQPLTVITFGRDLVAWTEPPQTPVHEARLEMWERSLIGAPSAPTVWRRVMWSGTVRADGLVEPRPHRQPSDPLRAVGAAHGGNQQCWGRTR